MTNSCIDVIDRRFMNKKNIMRCLVLMYTVFFCREALAKEKVIESKVIEKFASAEQRRLFGPFPDWKIQEGESQCIFLATHYLLNDKTNERDIDKSIVVALYHYENEDRYRLRYVIRKRCSGTWVWEEDGDGSCTIVLEGNAITLDFCTKAPFKGNVDVKVRSDEESRRYFVINFSYKWWHDELRLYIPSNKNDLWASCMCRIE